jgi:hypothetical protein
MLNWKFEASNDRVNWTLLDLRVHLSGHPPEDDKYIEDRQELCKKGATSTWGVDTYVYDKVGTEGFRYFRITQVGRNSSGSDNLALSGFELYGKVCEGKWP